MGRGGRHWTYAIPSLDGSTTSWDLISEVSPLRTLVIVSTATDVVVSEHQERVGVTSAITEQAPTQHSMVPPAQCPTVLTCVPLLD